VDKIIKRFQDGKRPATLGLIEQSIDLSIAFGAPAYNAGDRAACFRFYATTAKSLLTAFPDDASASEPAHKALADLRAALGRIKASGMDADRGAWSIRLAFDKTNLSVAVTTESAAALVRMGEEYFRRSEFEEAVDAFESATAALAELEGLAPERLPAAVRFAPLGLGNALFAEGRFEDASTAVLSGLGTMPEWTAIRFDLRALHGDPAEYEAILARLERAARDAPDNAPIHFLLGYEYWFTGKRDAARLEFERTLKIDPAHPGARRFLQAIPPGQSNGPRA
jgi:tetratricopeptide (TPR) repeat protein